MRFILRPNHTTTNNIYMAEDEENGIEYYGRKRPRKEILNGFDSDSEGYGGSDSEKEEEQSEEEPTKKDDDDDDDMFASDKEEEKPTKKEGFDVDEFEREQGLGKYDSERFDTEDLTDQGIAGLDVRQQQLDYHNNVEDLSGASEKPKLEVQIEAFNLREEAEQGLLDKDMNYVPKEEDEAEEAWLTDVKDSDIDKARKAQLQREAQAKKRIPRSTKELLSIVVNMLEPSETPLETLSRLAPKKKKGKRQPFLDVEKLRKQSVYELTGACDELMNEKGIPQLFDLSREELMRYYQRETGEEIVIHRGTKRNSDPLEETEEDYGPKEWEFRWTGEDQVNGPYSAYEMNYWKDSYFNDGVEVRRVGSEAFRPIKDDDF